MLYLIWIVSMLGVCGLCAAVSYLFDIWDWF